jgi:hypothetical protein
MSDAMQAESTSLGPWGRRLSGPALAIGLVGLAAGLGLGWLRHDGLKYFLHAYLLNYCFFLSLSLGGLFFVLVQHITRAGWSVAVRRLAELLGANIYWLILLFLPIVVPVLLGSSALYRWNDPAAVAGDELLRLKAPYLNAGFFGVRALVYLLVWWYLGGYYLRRSVQQDASGNPALTVEMERRSPLASILFGVTVTFAAFDWLMSLTPDWFSTIYGVYFFGGVAVAGLSSVILAAAGLQASGRMTDAINAEHYHDLGKLLFAFVIFWGYIAFSQYMLIWYANIPEETTWYLARQAGPWVWVSVALLFVHLLIPFFGLLSREAKRRKAALAFWAAWLLVAHWIDLYYLVMPSYEPASPLAGGALVPLGAVEICLLVGIGGIYLAGLSRLAGRSSLVPQQDPRLAESLAFENI